jgi:hypothetical protein
MRLCAGMPAILLMGAASQSRISAVETSMSLRTTQCTIGNTSGTCAKSDCSSDSVAGVCLRDKPTFYRLPVAARLLREAQPAIARVWKAAPRFMPNVSPAIAPRTSHTLRVPASRDPPARRRQMDRPGDADPEDDLHADRGFPGSLEGPPSGPLFRALRLGIRLDYGRDNR